MNREVMQQALEALTASLMYVDGEGSDNELDCHLNAIEALRTELAKPETKEPLTLRTDGYGVYKEKGKRLVDANGNFVAYLMSDEVASELIDPYHWSQPSQNCNRHPAAPHGIDIEASFRAGHSVCKCANWSTGEAS